MGRVKLKIKRLENTNGRQATYAKRRNGIMKKAAELSILCDIDIILLMFAPNGKPSLCRGRCSNFEEVITKFGQLTPQERTKRKLETLEALKKTFKKLDHDVNVQEFFGTSSQTIEDLSNQAKLLQTQIFGTHKRLSHWTEFDKISSVDQLGRMENSLRESLDQIRTRKENVKKQQQLVSLQCNNQLNEMNIPFRMTAQQQLQPLSWIVNDNGQNIVLPEDSNMFLHKDVEGSVSSSFRSYDNYFGSSIKTDMSSSTQENGVLSDMSNIAPMRLQLNGQFPCLQYNFNLLNNLKFQPSVEINPHENHVDYHVNEGFEAPRSSYDSNNHHGWASTSGSCGIIMFEEQLYAQASFTKVNIGFT
ncbi:agamous-like MADS-box protein AGL30 [Glycine soja]|uniref:agamous-like MADS-box protein AGL30 n=1 Tax=Glycine soja TaxID=3848 RepID=UPI00103AA939|nr:agamous-like MADS-box protein AGL30 [Glycine soja]